MACRKAWHGECYTPHAMDNFFHHVAVHEDGFDWSTPADLLCYKEARAGDHLLTAFQCDICSFPNLQHRDPLPDLPRDNLLLCCIRRSNLDALLGREPSTVRAKLRGVKHLLRMWTKVDIPPPLPPIGPFPVQDSLGLGVAVAMLLKTLEAGKNHKGHQQFETVRNLGHLPRMLTWLQ
jgi:hypothetical protein